MRTHLKKITLWIVFLLLITACQTGISETAQAPSAVAPMKEAEPVSSMPEAEEDIPAEENSAAPMYEAIDASPAPDKFSFVKIVGNGASLEEILFLEAQKALEQGRDPFVDFYADWCPPCIAIEESMDDPKMIDAFSGTYIIQIDFDEWKGKSVDAGFYVLGVPTYYEIDAEGRSTGRMITGGAWGEDTAASMAPPMKAFFAGE
mgnify:CR=1 FL=1